MQMNDIKIACRSTCKYRTILLHLPDRFVIDICDGIGVVENDISTIPE